MNNNDKIYNYWKNSYNLQKTKSKPKNNIKINAITNHEGLYEIEETSNINDQIFIKSYKFNKNDLTNYINSRKQTYKIYYSNSNELITKKDDNPKMLEKKNINTHPEYRNNTQNLHLSAYKSSYKQRFN